MSKPSLLTELSRWLPEGWVATSSTFSQRGYSRSLLARYVKSGWLEPLVHGVFRRPGHQPLVWQQLVLSLQHIETLPYVVSGKTALGLMGLSHYLQLGNGQDIELSGPALPRWLNRLGFAPELKRLVPVVPSGNVVSVPWGESGLSILMAPPEQAMLELIAGMPDAVDFDTADNLMAGMMTLSPIKVQHILESCTHIKAKRLFLWFAERHQHPWFDRLQIESIYLGVGKRQIFPGGRLHPRWLITMPEDIPKWGAS